MSVSDYTRIYTYEEIRDFALYVAKNILDYKEIELYKKNKLVLKQMGVFENLLLEAFNISKKRENCIYFIVFYTSTVSAPSQWFQESLVV